MADFRLRSDGSAVSGHNVHPGAEEVAKAFSRMVAETYLLLVKTHGFHWNVRGPLFKPLHDLFEQQYRELFEAADVLAERVRALGFFAPGSTADFAELAETREQRDIPDAEAMVRELAADHERLAAAFREIAQLCERVGDLASQDIANERVQVHDKAAWMLRSSLPAREAGA